MAKLYFYYSAMNAGKTTTLLQSSHNYVERGMSTLLLKPQIDDREGTTRITSRIGLEGDAYCFTKTEDLYKFVMTFNGTSQSEDCSWIYQHAIVSEWFFI